MVRSATALAAVLILPGFLLAQQATPSHHKVVRGDNLWDLAEHFYKDPFQWRRIWQANKGEIKDPNLIFPGQTFVIPGAQAKVTAVKVQSTPAQQPARTPVAPPEAPTETARRHTVFYSGGNGGVSGAGNAAVVEEPAVSRMEAYAAPWLLRGEGDPAHVGTVVAHAGPHTPSEMLVPYDRVELDLGGHTARVGEEFLTYRVTRTIPTVGRVVTPTGVVKVAEIHGSDVTGVVTEVYDRLAMGDLLGPVPPYDLRVGEGSQPVSNGPAAMVMGFATPAQLGGVGQIAFLDLGSADGVAVGDVFEVRDWHRGGHRMLGRLRVIGVKAHTSSARVVYILDDVFHQGVVVRLASKMD